MSDVQAWTLTALVLLLGALITWRWHRGRRMRLVLNPGYTENDVRQLLELRHEAMELVRDAEKGGGYDQKGRLRRLERRREEIMARAAKRKAHADTQRVRAQQKAQRIKAKGRP